MRIDARELLAVGLTVSAVVLGALLLGGSLAPRWMAFAQQQPRPVFEVASIKPNNTAANNGEIHFTGGASGGRLTAENVPVRFLVQWAYHIREFQLSGGPGWLASEKFDIAAKPEGGASADRMRLMMQTLLEERFKLRLHRETKEHSLYTLVPAKSGIKLQPSTADCEALARVESAGQPSRRQCGAWFRGENQFTGTKISMSEFVEDLSNLLDRPVVDKTGFTADFDVTLQWTPEEQRAAPDGLPDNSDATASPAIFTALQEQLGLKLDFGKGPVETIVIDHIEKPSEN